MAEKKFNECLWLLNTIRSFGPITYEEINSLWKKSSQNKSGKGIPKKTFRNHLDAIADSLSIEIVCQRKGGYLYSVRKPADSWSQSHLDSLLYEISLLEIPSCNNTVYDDGKHDNFDDKVFFLLGIIKNHLATSFSVKNKRIELVPLGLFYSDEWYVVGTVEGRNLLRHFHVNDLMELSIKERKLNDCTVGFSIKEYVESLKSDSLCKAAPIIKWAGGKRQLLPELQARIPRQYGTYVEPFLGGGSLFFLLQPKKALLNDSNKELMSMYCCVRDNAAQLYDVLCNFQREYNALANQEDRDRYYYEKRILFNERMDEPLGIVDAALFIFLNRTCFNGLYRVNSLGQMNTPSGKNTRFGFCSKAQIMSCSEALSGKTLVNGDFESVCENLHKGDFVYFDPPYQGGFDVYQPGGFTENDHHRLRDLYERLTRQGVYCLLSYSNTEFIKKLYRGYAIDIVNARRFINSDATKREGIEVIIKNY